MTTTDDRYQEIAVTPNVDDQPITDVGDFISELAELARAADGQPTAMAEGSFALYPMEDGGLMFVTAVQDGPLTGIKHMRMPPSLIRAVAVFATGGSKMQAVKAFIGGGRRKAIGGK